jgi:hypothetical protein
MNQGSRTGKGTAFMVERPEELCPGGDRASVGAKKRLEMVHYADDFIVLCRSQEQAQQAHEQIRRWVEENALTVSDVEHAFLGL